MWKMALTFVNNQLIDIRRLMNTPPPPPLSCLKQWRWGTSVILETFSITFFMGNCKPQTAKCHVTTALRSRLQFAVHVWTAGRASCGKWFTARFFATKNWTASRLKVWTSFLYPFAMCLLDFWSRINELLLIFGRLKWCTSTWWKQHGGLKQWTRT